MLIRFFPFVLLLAVSWTPLSAAEQGPSDVVIESTMTHVRTAAEREWAWSPKTPESQSFQRRFTAPANSQPWTLTLRQQNVKQSWEVRLNDRSVGRLVRDENDMQSDFTVPAGLILEGENHLELLQSGKDSDDIKIGQIRLRPHAVDVFRNQATIQVKLVDASGEAMPGRITIVDVNGTLIPIGAAPEDGSAIRQGVFYTSSGDATFGVAAGDYRVMATRGFEYSVAQTNLSVSQGQHERVSLKLDRQVDTAGWVACDTHVHTVTHSGHGDCTIQERMATLAGEGIELPIATDHNKAIDYRPAMTSLEVTSHFTPVIGDECTTKKGHFNIFPIRPQAMLPDHNQEDWETLFKDIYSTPDVRVAILNHARDIHSGFRPFSPSHHVSLTGENLEGRPMNFNAMEIINSGAVQTDAMQLFHDWCGLINRGIEVTPVGSSDSHDVARFIVGQGRTYIRCDDSDPAKIDVDQALDAFTSGRVIVSYGLMTKLSVGQGSGPGDFVTPADGGGDIVVTAEVHGPAWAKVDSVALYVCGRERFRSSVDQKSQTGASLKASVTWRIPRSECVHDLWFSAVAVGPGISEPYWPTALPYQPTSIEFAAYTFSSTGVIQVDVDRDGAFTAPYGYATQIVEQNKRDPAKMLKQLSDFDASVIHQVASILRESGQDLALMESLAEDRVSTEIARYRRAYQRSVVARLEGVE